MKLDTIVKMRTVSHSLNGAHRAASTLGPGRAQLLQKKHDDIVITFAKRTAMGRATKGQLKHVPVDELLYRLFKVRLWLTSLPPFCVDPYVLNAGYSGENEIEPGVGR